MADFAAKFNVIRSRWVTEVATAQSLLTQYDNDNKFKQPETGPWARFSIRMGDSELMAIGATKRTRNEGTIFANLFDDIGRGDKALLDLSDIIVPLFRNRIVSGVTFRTPRVDNVGVEEGWWQVNVVTSFYFDDIVASEWV